MPLDPCVHFMPWLFPVVKCWPFEQHFGRHFTVQRFPKLFFKHLLNESKTCPPNEQRCVYEFFKKIFNRLTTIFVFINTVNLSIKSCSVDNSYWPLLFNFVCIQCTKLKYLPGSMLQWLLQWPQLPLICSFVVLLVKVEHQGCFAPTQVQDLCDTPLYM